MCFFGGECGLSLFLCLKGLGPDSFRVKTLNDNPYMSMTWETEAYEKQTISFIRQTMVTLLESL